MDNSNGQVKMKRALGFWSTYFAVFGCMLSGTAMVALGNVAGYGGSSVWLPALIAVIPMLAVALAYSELVSMVPGGGMVFEYTMPALGRFWAIFATLAGYLLLVTADGGTQLVIAGIATGDLLGVPHLVVTVLIFALAVAIHLAGISLYGKIEALASIIMCTIFAILGIIGAFGLGAGEQVNTLTPLQPENGWATVVGQAGAAIWWFIGFEFVCPTAEENKRPHKNIPRALIFGVITIVLFDLLFAYASVRYTDLDVLMTSTTPHIATARALIGPLGWVCMTVITLCAAFTSVMVHLVALPRLLYGLAYKDCAPKIFMYLHPKFRTPWVGIFFTSGLILVTLIYIQLNGADVNVILGLVNIASVTWMCSYGIALIDVLVLRRRYPDYPRLTRFPGMPAFMCIGLVGLAYCIWTLRSSWLYAGVALVLIAAYCVLWLRHKKLSLFEPQPLEDMVSTLMARAEPYPEWDQAVTAWLKQREQAHV